jgi:hypothetical protein
MLVPRTEATQVVRMILSAVDVFSLWSWVLVGMGVVITGQLSRKAAVFTCVVFGLVSTVAKMAPAMAALGGGGGP